MPAPLTTLPRRLGLFSAISVVVGTMIGSGIFRSPAAIADKLPGPAPLLSVWILGGLLALCGTLTLAEVASALPRSGGIYAFLHEAWGRLPAFLFGWAELTVIRAAATGAISLTFAQYLFRLLGLDPHGMDAHWAAAIAIALIAVVNVIGVKWGAALQNVTTVAKYGALLLVATAAFVVEIPRTGGHYLPAAPAGSFAVAPFGLALVSVLWAFDGWADLTFVGGEVRDPGRNLPRALIGGTLAVLAIYLAANLAYLAAFSIDEIRRSPRIAADVGQLVFGDAGALLVGITVVVSTFGALNATLLTTPRIFYAMANDGLFFRQLAAVHPRFQTPFLAIALNAALGIAFVLLRTFEQLTDAFVVAILPFYLLGVAAIFRLRRRPDHDPPFRVPGYPLTPLPFLAAAIYLLVNGAIDPTSRWATMGVLGAIAAGVPVFYLTVGRRAAAI